MEKIDVPLLASAGGYKTSTPSSAIDNAGVALVNVMADGSASLAKL
jgi:hypothetical protein